jgi:Chaperone of endosialidase
MSASDSSPQSKPSVNGNFAVGADYNAATPADGAIIEGNVLSSNWESLILLTMRPMKCDQCISAAAVLALFLGASDVNAQNVGIGLSNPQSKLTLNGNLAVGADYNLVAPTNGALIEGSVGIGGTAPRTQLEVAGIIGVIATSTTTYPATENLFTIGWNNFQRGDGIAELVNYCGTGNGNAFDFFLLPNAGTPTVSNIISDISRAGAYNQLSDERLKTNVQPLRYGLREIMALEPKEYDFHTVQSMTNGEPTFASGEMRQIGFLAQQVLKVLPEAVEKPADPKTEFYKMGYASFIPVLVSAVQELKHLQDETVAQQQAKITEQESKIAFLQAELASLKASNDKLAAIAAKVEALEKAVNSVQEKENAGVRTVAVTQ